jgi:hypothetical protein
VIPDEPATTTLKRSDTGPASKTIGPHKSNILNILDPRVQPVPELMKGKRASEQSGVAPDSETSHRASEPNEVMGVRNTHGMSEHKTTSTGMDNAADTPTSMTSPNSADPESPSKPAKQHKSAILNFLDPRVKKSKSEKTDHAAVSEEAIPTESTDTNESHGAHEQKVASTSLVGAANGHNPAEAHDAAASHVTADTPPTLPAAMGVNPTLFGQTSTPTDTTPLGTSSPAAAPEHATAANAADGKGGVITGERAKIGDASNPYSAAPVDPRIDMPGKYPESAAGN